jgi:hypothetical protein
METGCLAAHNRSVVFGPGPFKCGGFASIMALVRGNSASGGTRIRVTRGRTRGLYSRPASRRLPGIDRAVRGRLLAYRGTIDAEGGKAGSLCPESFPLHLIIGSPHDWRGTH